MRINARLDEDHKHEWEYLMRTTGSRVSGVIKRSIDALRKRVQGADRRSKDLLMSSGFVGCGDGMKDLSVTYKDQLDTSLRSKHGHR